MLESVVKSWLQDVKRGLNDPFVLEEDGDSGHGGSRLVMNAILYAFGKNKIVYNRTPKIPRR